MPATVTEYEPGKFRATWPTVTVKTKDNHYLSGRPETVLALTGGAKVVSNGESSVNGSREYCERQL